MWTIAIAVAAAWKFIPLAAALPPQRLSFSTCCFLLLLVLAARPFSGFSRVQRAVDTQVEERQISHAPFHPEAGTQCPDVFHLERRLLPDDLVLVPRLAVSGVALGCHDEHVVRPNMSTIDFSGFDPLLARIEQVILHYATVPK